MPLDVNGLGDLMTDIAGMASKMDADGAGAPVAKGYWRLPPCPSMSR